MDRESIQKVVKLTESIEKIDSQLKELQQQKSKVKSLGDKIFVSLDDLTYKCSFKSVFSPQNLIKLVEERELELSKRKKNLEKQLEDL